MHKTRLWLIAISSLLVVFALWAQVQSGRPAPERVATPTEVPPPAAELADDEPAATASQTTPTVEVPSAPGAELPQPSAATPAAAPANGMFQNTPRKRSAEPMRLHFANTPQTPTPGIGLSKAACAELRERQQHAESLSERERLLLQIDCRGR